MSGKKGLTHARLEDLHRVAMPLSKAALCDLLGDVLDCNFGEDWTPDALVFLARPRLRIRADKEPRSWLDFPEDGDR